MMKTSKIFIMVLLALFIFNGAVLAQKNTKGKDDFPVLKGPYLGQKPPGKIPEIFAPGLITTHYSQSYIAFLNEARVCVYSATTEKGHETFYTYEKNGCWTRPQKAPFEELQGHPNYTTGPLGRKVYFHSGNPTHPNDTRYDDNIWTIEWTGSGWAEPKALPAPANSDYGEAYPSAAADGSVYFFTWRREGTRGYDIWMSRCIDEKYQDAERLPWPINTDFIEYDPYVAPDGSFIIFGSTRPGGYGNSDNYICFRKSEGGWTSPINLGLPLNSSSFDLCANGTPDGKYFFFISGRKTEINKGDFGKKYSENAGEDSDLYWVDFSFVNDLKNIVLVRQNAAQIIKQDYKKNGILSAIDILNKLYANQKDRTYFSSFELLYLCKEMMCEEKDSDADLFFSALDKVMPNVLLVKEGYAQFCVMNGRVSKGLKILQKLAVDDPNFNLSDSLSGIGYLLTLYPDKTADALSVLKFTVEKFPEDPWPYYSLARVYRKTGNLEKAIENCRMALEIKPGVGDMSQLLERLLQEKEKHKKEYFPVLTGPYLGQRPPGLKAEIFAPGIISSKEKYELNSVFSPKGDEFYYEISTTIPEEKKKGKYFYIIMVTKLVKGVWTKPEMVSFSGKYATMDMYFSPDGNRMYFTSDRPNQYDSSPKNNIWYVDRVGDGWSEPKILGPPIYLKRVMQGQVSLAANGTLYFRSADDLFYAKYQNEKFLKPVKLPKEINSPYAEGKPFVALDESYLLFVRYEMPTHIDGGKGLYISFKNKDGRWMEAKNTNIYGSLPRVTPDGKYFFFSRGGDIYWVDARIIEKLKPKNL
jgi:tetratricopeptide (TPR) repeat protein